MITIKLIYQLIFSYFFLNILGFSLIRINFIRSNLEILPIIGAALFTISLNFFYFFFLFDLKQSLIAILIIVFILTYLNRFYVKIFLTAFVKNLLNNILIISFFFIILGIYGRVFFIFRGNHWDYLNYLNYALVNFSYSFNSILAKPELIYNNIGPYLFDRPIINVTISSIHTLSNLDIFYSGFIFKILCLCLFTNSSYFFLKNFFINKKSSLYFLNLFLPFNFWIFYIYEIDALAQLYSYSLFITLLALISKIHDFYLKNDKNFFFVFLILLSSLFLIYPEIFFILLAILGVFLHFSIYKYRTPLKKIRLFFYQIFFFLTSFLLLTLPGYKMTYGNIFEKIFKNVSGNISDYWGYYGSFILGKESIILNINNINLIRDLWEQNKNFSIFFKITGINIEQGYYFSFINIPLSLSGLFPFTIGKINYWYENIYILLAIFLLLFLIKNITLNIKKIFIEKENFYILCKSIITVFILLSLILLYNKSYWSVIKLYFFISYIILLTIVFKYNKKYFSVNYIFLILITLFPFYQYSENNHGIGKINSFPSIIRKSYKQEFSWEIPLKEIFKCKKVYVDIDNDRYNWHKFAYVNIFLTSYNIENELYKKSNLEKNIKNNICIISENKKNFIISNL